MPNKYLNCSLLKNNPNKIETHVWEPATSYSQRKNADFAGPYLDRYFFKVVHCFPKFSAVKICKNTSVNSTIDDNIEQYLRQIDFFKYFKGLLKALDLNFFVQILQNLPKMLAYLQLNIYFVGHLKMVN